MPKQTHPALQVSFREDQKCLQSTMIPIVTVTGTFREDIKAWHHLSNDNTTNDHILSRAHFSMAYGVARSVWGTTPQPHKAWMVDPTNYISPSQWPKFLFTEKVGQILARVPFLKAVKDQIDAHGRNKLPILESITPPLLQLFENVHHPILSFHIAAGNILASLGKPVVQVITDPHVRSDYLNNAHLKNMRFCVFDHSTKVEAIEKAAIMGKTLDPDRIIVTGPPIDYRIVTARMNKKAPTIRPVRIVITTGGLGTNKGEIRTLLEQLLPLLRKRQQPYQLLVYCGTQKDIFEMVQQLAENNRVNVNVLTNHSQPASPAGRPITHNALNVIFHPQIYDANELLIKHGFPWADIFICKPSGDMAYDAVACGAALLTLNTWGVWEEHIAEIFRQKHIARTADVEHIVEQLHALTQTKVRGTTWLQHAMNHCQTIDKLYLQGAKNIVKVMKQMA